MTHADVVSKGRRMRAWTLAWIAALPAGALLSGPAAAGPPPAEGPGRPFGGKTMLTPPVGSPEGDAYAGLQVKYFPTHGRRAERSWFRAKVRRLEPSTDYTLWADDPATPEQTLVQFDSFTTGRTGSFNYSRDTKRGEALPFGMMLGNLAGRSVEVRDAAGNTTLLGGGVTSSVGPAPSAVVLTAAVPSATLLATARSFAVLGASTVTNTGSSVLNGDLGLYAGTSITGIFAVDGGPGTVNGTIHLTDATAQQAQIDAQAAYNTLAAMTFDVDLSGQDLGGMTLTPGVYSFSSTAQLTGMLKLDARCDPAATFVFQIGTTLTTAASSSVVVINGDLDYDESNIHWQVGTSATLGAGTTFRGNILANASIALAAGTTMEGGALALTGAVTLSSNTVTCPPLPAATSTILISPYWGHGTDSQTAGLDRTKILLAYAYAGTSDGAMTPSTEGMTVILGPLGETSPLTLVIPANDTGWTQSGNVWSWGKIQSGVDWRVSVDDVNHTMMVYAGGFDFSPGNGPTNVWGGGNGLAPNNETFPWYMKITCADDVGEDVSCFRNSLTFNHAIQWGVLRIP